jgi:hypothetical protein
MVDPKDAYITKGERRRRELRLTGELPANIDFSYFERAATSTASAPVPPPAPADDESRRPA